MAHRRNKCVIFTQHIQRSWGVLREIVIGFAAYAAIISIFIATTPFQIYRKFVTYLAKSCDEDITTCITGLSATFLRDFDSYHEKSLHTSVAIMKMKGEVVEASVLQKAFLERVVLKKKDDNPAQLAYPELQQHYTRFMGYSFFKWDRKFDIRNHVISYPNSEDKDIIVTRKSLIEIWEYLMIKPYSRDRSPWEVIIVPNYIPDEDEENPPDWFIFLRLHHGLADGLWFEKILSHLFIATYEPNFTTKLVSSVTPTQRFLMNFRCLIFGPYDLLNRALRFREDYHALHAPYNKLSKTFWLVEGPTLHKENIKKLKNHFKVAFTTILLEIICGGMRRFMIKKKMQIPELFSIGMPFPKLREREDKMGNDFYLTIIDLPVDLPQIRDRVLAVQKTLEGLRHSSCMQMLDVVLGQITNLPSPILRAVTRKSLFSTAYSSLPGPEVTDEGDFFGNFRMFDANFSHGMASDSLSLAFSTVTFLGNMKMTVFVDKVLVNGREGTQEILDCLMEEYEDLMKIRNRDN